MPVPALPVQIFTLPPFRGLDLKDGPLVAPQYFARIANFVDFDLYGAVAKAKAPTKVNSTQIANNPAVVAMSEYIQTDDTAFFIIYTSNGKMYKVSYADGSLTDITPSNVTFATSGAFPHFFRINNLLLFGDGTNIPIYVYDTVTSSKWFELGESQPASALTAVTGAAGALTGSYQYKYTFVSPTGAESIPSAASGSVTATAHQIDLSNITVHSDTAENRDTGFKRNIYRTDAGGSQYYYLTSINDNTTTTYTDNTPDSGLGALLFEERDKPIAGLWGFTEYNGSVYAFKNGSSDLWYSNINTPEEWSPFNYEPITPNLFGNIKGLGILNNLVIFKEHCIDNWIGLPGLFRRVRKVKGIGCVSHRTIQNVDLPNGGEVLFFLSRYGVRFYDEQDSFLISREIEPIFNGRDTDYKFNHASAHKCDSVYSQNDRRYILSIPVNGSTDNNLLLIYDVYAGSWSVRSPLYAGSITTRLDTESKDELIIGESRSDVTYGGFVHQLEGGDDYIGEDYSGSYVTQWSNLGVPNNTKMLKYIEVDAVSQGDFDLLADIYVNGEITPSITVSIPLTEGGAEWDDDYAIFDVSTFSFDQFVSAIASLKRVQCRYLSIGFRTDEKNKPWSVLQTRVRFVILPNAGDRK